MVSSAYAGKCDDQKTKKDISGLLAEQIKELRMKAAVVSILEVNSKQTEGVSRYRAMTEVRKQLRAASVLPDGLKKAHCGVFEYYTLALRLD